MDITNPSTVYTFAELTEPAAHRALDTAQELPGPWWDHDDTEHMAEVICHVLAQELGTPGHHSGSSTGIAGVDVTVWDQEGERITFQGVLTPANAPALPWDGTQPCSLRITGLPLQVHTGDHLFPDHLVAAVQAAVLSAWQAGRACRAARIRRNVLEWIAGAQPVFTADGAIRTDPASAHLRAAA